VKSHHLKTTDSLQQLASSYSDHPYGDFYTYYNFDGTEDTGPLQVSLGSEVSEAITGFYKYWTQVSGIHDWKKRTVNFTYKDTSGSAILKFMQFFNGKGLPCVHCYVLENLYLSAVTLTQISGAAPVLTVNKELAGNRVADTDQFTVQILQNGTVVNSIANSTTSGIGSIVNSNSGTTGPTTLVSGTSYAINEVASGTTKLAQYTSTLTCTDSTGANRALALNTAFTLQDDDVVSCKITNTAKAPVLRLTKALGTGGRANPADQFTVQIFQRLAPIQSGTTSGSGSSVVDGTTGWVTLTRDLPYNLNEVMAPNSGSLLTQYTNTVSCTNAFVGSTTVVPSTLNTAFTPAPGDVLDCTVTNTPKPVTLQVTQRLVIAAPYVFSPVTFTYTGNNGWATQDLYVPKDYLVTPGKRQTLAAINTATTVSINLPQQHWQVATNRCTDENWRETGNPSTYFVSSTTGSITIPANRVRAGAQITCAMLQSYKG
jgi:hypothetical protein